MCQHPSPMKAHSAFSAAALALALPSVAWMQAQPAPAKPTADEPVALDAFHVSASSDVGYMATNTLAGTRLNTPLRDVGTAVSIVTKEFLTDVSANDSSTLLTYTVSTEIGGIEGNYAGGNFGVSRPDQNSARAEPERNQRVRGLASAELTRDYFLSDIPFDSYSTERVTINRGPNALLFGIGSPGGVINNSTIAPNFGENFYEAKLQLGQRGSHRETVDFNRVIIPKRVAIRGAALNEDTEFRQRPAWEKDRRVFGAIVAVLAENRRSPILGRTTLRANGEYGDIQGNPPNVLPPNDGLTSWWQLPSRDLERFTGTPVPAYFTDGTFTPRVTVDNRAVSLPGTVPASIAIPYFLHLGLIYSRPGDPNFGFANPAFSNVHGGLSRILYTPAANGRQQMNQMAARHVYSTANFPGFRIPAISDRRVFDYYNRLYTGDSNFSGRDFKAGTVTLEQSFWRDRIGLEATYDFQLYRSTRMFPWGAGEDSGTGNADVIIDVSQYASNDQPNPNLGRPYYRTIGMPESTDRVQRDSRRLTGFIQLNARDAFGEGRAAFWLGRHVLTGLLSDQIIKTNSRNYGLGWDSQQVDLTSLLTSTIEMYRRQVTPVVYVGPSLLNTARPEDVRLEQINVRLPRSGDTHTMFYYDASTRQVRNAEFSVRRYLNSGNVGRREIESGVASLQSYLLGEHIVGLVGMRHDHQTVYERVNYDNDPDPTTRDRLATGDFNPDAIRLQSRPSDEVRGDTLTWSVVGRFPEKILGRLPLNSDLRLFYNFSENFNPVGARRNVFNELLPAPVSETKEYGAIVELLGGKVSARFNLFETTGDNFSYTGLNGAVNQSINNVGDWLNRMLEAERQGYSLERAGVAQAGFTSYGQVYQSIINFVPQTTRAITNYRIETVNGIPRVVSNPIVGAVTTSGFVAKGWELDLTANPTAGLRVMFNVSKQETVQSNIGRDLQKIASETFANINASPLRDVPDSPVLGETSTYRTRYNGRVIVPLAAELAKEGTVSLEQRKWRVNSAVSYDFRGERLKGWGVGVGMRWQSAVATGYPTFVGSDGTPLPDLAHPFMSGDETNGDTWLSYKRKLFKGRVGWRIQLNVRNAIGSSKPIPVFTNPNGEIALVRVPPLTEWVLTNTFRF
jgi:outer membrane receptor protein involved in Fe transport